MYKIRGNLAVKIIAVVLFTVFCLSFAASTFAGVVLANMGAYHAESYRNAQKNMLDWLGNERLWAAGSRVFWGWDKEEIYPNEDFFFEVWDEDGKKLYYANYDGRKALWSGSKLYHVEPDEAERFLERVGAKKQEAAESKPVEIPQPMTTPQPGALPMETPQPTGIVPDGEVMEVPVTERPVVDSNEPVFFLIKGYIGEKDEHPRDVESFYLELLDELYEERYSLIGIAVASLLAALGLLLFLFLAAGRRSGHREVCLNLLDRKIPYDIFSALLITAFSLLLLMAAEFGAFLPWDSDFAVLRLGVSAVGFVGAGLVCLWWLLSTAARLKKGGILRQSFCGKIVFWCWNLIKKVLLSGYALLKKVPLVRQGMLVLAAVMVVEFIWICIAGRSQEAHLFGWLVERVAVAAGLVYVLLCAKRLRKGARDLAEGREDARVDSNRMYGPFREHAEDLNHIGEGISRAVDERMKSERFKTELITNVSHDIKTPLTSIINYVDLLEKEEPENEKMREYLEVLERQSAKLKKLIEDLIEASKASTGNLSVNFERCELGVLLEQTAGEYSERLEARELELVLKKPEEPIYIRADGRHMWRIFDNLMNNVCKYAQPRTRVYLSLEQQGEKAHIIFRNISGAALNISGEELMERFVRGDASRNTEGSGLGLSIARSLVQLQKGEMKLTVDGDLFKVELIFSTQK